MMKKHNYKDAVSTIYKLAWSVSWQNVEITFYFSILYDSDLFQITGPLHIDQFFSHGYILIVLILISTLLQGELVRDSEHNN